MSLAHTGRLTNRPRCSRRHPVALTPLPARLGLLE